MQLRQGGARPRLQLNPLADYGTGSMGAYAVGLALLHKHRTGEGQHVDTSLAYTAMTLQSPFMQMYEGKVWNEPSGRDCLGSRPLHRAYKASDGWLFIGARDVAALAGVPELSDLTSMQGPALEEFLEERFALDSVDSWVNKLVAADIGAHRCVNNVAALMTDPYVLAHKLSVRREHPVLGDVTTVGPAPRLSHTPVRIGACASQPGADAPDILGGIGRTDDLEALIADGVIKVDGVRAGW